MASKEVEQTEADSTLRMLIRLWSHETTRVYLDRNIDSKERMWFLKLMETCIKYCFCGVSFEENFGGAKERGLFRPSGGHTANLGKSVNPTCPAYIMCLYTSMYLLLRI